jgi:hypothetical protein
VDEHFRYIIARAEEPEVIPGSASACLGRVSLLEKVKFKI